MESTADQFISKSGRIVKPKAYPDFVSHKVKPKKPRPKKTSLDDQNDENVITKENKNETEIGTGIENGIETRIETGIETGIKNGIENKTEIENIGKVYLFYIPSISMFIVFIISNI